MFEFENEAKSRGFNIICGVDEAGRGPLAGPVYAAAVILPDDFELNGINDSKKLSEKKREQLFNYIIENAVSYCIATASVQEIEEINILNAAMLAMKRAVKGLNVTPEIAFVDGNKSPDIDDVPVQTIVKGDSKSASVAAASILAKVSRDRYMRELAEKYPEYKFEKHKGYGTKVHYEIIEKYGICPEHRPSFLKKFFKKGE